jgi:hypothetical protein
LFAALKRTVDLPLLLRYHCFEEGGNRFPADEVAAGHLGDSLFQGDFVLYFAVKLNAGDLIDRNLLLHDHVFERKCSFDLLVVLNALSVQLQDHFFGLQGLADLQVDELFDLFALEGRVHVEVAGLLVG